MKPLRLLVLLLACVVVLSLLSTNADMHSNRAVPFDPTNSPPVASNDTFPGHGLVFTIGPLWRNATDPDGDPMTAVPLTQPTHGVLSNVDGSFFSYQLNDQEFTGDDTFTYKACDFPPNSCSNPATITIHITNSPPVPGPDKYDVRGNTIIGPLLINDSDPDHDSLTDPMVVVGAAHGTVYGIPGPPDIKEYDPDPGFAGTDSFVYQICDSLNACATTTVTLHVVADGENSGTVTCNARKGGPINVTNGNMYLRQADYALPSVGPGISVGRTYNSNSQRIGLFGRGWSSEYDESIVAYDNNLARLNRADGRAIYLGRAVGSSGAFAPLEGDFHGSLVQNGANGFTLTMNDGSVHQFNSTGKLLSLADRIGNQTTLTYNTGGTLTSVTDPFSRVLSFSSNGNDQVLSISDTVGTIATYVYGGGSNLQSVTYADNSAFQFAYDGNNRLTTVTDALGNVVESHTYDGQGRALTSERHGGVEHYSLNYVSATETDVTDALSHLTKYTIDKSKGRNVVTRVEGLCSCGGGGGSQVQTWTYDNQLNVTAKTDALNHTTTFTYDGNGNRLSETDPTGTVSYTYNQFSEVLTRTDQMNGVTTNTYDTQGNLLTTKDALNNITTFTHDSHGQPLTATDARGKVTTFTWDSSGRLTQTKDALNHTTDFAYDSRARLTGVTNSLNQTTSYEYDPAGRLKKTTLPDGNFVSNTYDLAGRQTKFTDARGNDTNFAYDNAYRLTTVTDALSHTTSYGYDAMSNQTSVTDALARVTNYEYDDFNRLKTVIYPPATGGATRLQETIEYDAVGNVQKKTDTAGRDTTYLYDAANRLTRITDPALQATQFEYNARSQTTGVLDAANQHYTFAYDALGRSTGMTRASVSMSYAYDAVGNRTQRTDYNGATTNYTYDDLNRLATISYPDSTSAGYAYDALSRLASAANQNGTVTFSYDNRGRVFSTTDVWGQTVGYGYDPNGNRTAMTLNGSTFANYVYDAVNRLTQIIDGNSLAVNYGYDATSKLTARMLPNGVTSAFDYDGLDRLTHLSDSRGGTTVADNQYAFNNASQITQKTDLIGGHGYSYDVVDRLTAASHPDETIENYNYDGVGNRTAGNFLNYTYGTFNRLAGVSSFDFSQSASYAYNANGNLVSQQSNPGNSLNYTYDFENRLTQALVTIPGVGSHPRPIHNTITYKYDALGRRIERRKNSKDVLDFVYDGQDVIQDLDGVGNVVTTYLNGPGIDNKIRQTDANGNLYYTTDHLGSTIALTDQNGNVIEQQTYDSFGNGTGSSLTRYTYTGREFDSDTGLYYYRARFYNPQVGRFISEDPIGLYGGINAYAYVANNPLSLTDESGLCPQDPAPHQPDPCALQVLTRFNLTDSSDGNPPIIPYVQTAIAQDFLDALLEINRAVPGGIGFTEVFRTRAHQQELWDNRGNNPNPVAHPGTSRHEGGFAFDVPGMATRDRNRHLVQTPLGRTVIPIFANHGFAWGGAFNDPPHFQADPTLHGYANSAGAATAANNYYNRCIGGR